MFRFKQRGRAAEDARNIFYYLTYEGAVDLEAIQDPLQRQVKLRPVIMTIDACFTLASSMWGLDVAEAGIFAARGKG